MTTKQLLFPQTETGHSQHTHIIPSHSSIMSHIQSIVYFLDNLLPRQVKRPDLVENRVVWLMAHMTMMLATSPLLQPMTLSTMVCVGIPACDRDRLGSEILHTGTMKLGREWSLPSWHQLSRCFQGKSHLRLKNGLQKNGFYEFWCRFQWRIHWKKSGGSNLAVARDVAV